jgi:hypothetical protein
MPADEHGCTVMSGLPERPMQSLPAAPQAMNLRRLLHPAPSYRSPCKETCAGAHRRRQSAPHYLRASALICG